MVKNLKKYIFLSVLAILTLALASCGKGSLKIEKLSIDYTTVKTTYIINEVVDFSGFKATVIYTDESLNRELTYNDVEFNYDNDITSTVGEKEIDISFVDPYLNTIQHFPLKIKVLTEFSIDPDDELLVIGFNRPSNLVSFSNNNNSAGTSNYGDSDFASEFAVGNQPYYIGNENEFKFVPEFTIFNKTKGEIRKLSAFYSDVDIAIIKGGQPVYLNESKTDNLVSYDDDNGTHYVTVDIYNGTYSFSENAQNRDFKIKVKADDEHYKIVKDKEITLDARVIKAYNIYEAWQLCVIDNNPQTSNQWFVFKGEHGLHGVEVSGIVLHNDIKVTAKDVPDNFLYTTTSEVVYKNAFSGETTVIPAGTKYLKNYSNLYYRRSTEDFTIQGNMFNIDFSSFPLVPSPGVFGPDAGLHYGPEYSTSFAFRFEASNSTYDSEPSRLGVVRINNLSLIGNASRNNLVDSTENLVSGGGLMFMSFGNHTQAVVTNVIGNSFFCTYQVNGSGDMIGKNLKNFDAYLNFVTVATNSTLNISDSYFYNSGGPAILAINDKDANKSPTVKIVNTKCETGLTGEELWFRQMGINAFMPQLFDLNNKLVEAGLGSFTNGKKQMNIKGILSYQAMTADEIVNGISAKGSIYFDSDGIERTHSNSHWKSIYSLATLAIAAGKGSPLFITANDAKGNHTTIWYDGSNLYNLSNNQLYTPDSNSAVHKAFNNATSITLTFGGISIVGEFFH